MGFWELMLLAVGVSMDAFAVSICKGLSTKKTSPLHMAKCGVWFGGFQALMPLIGFLLGSLFAEAIQAVDHWIAFGLLGIIGFNMLKEAFSKEDECACCNEKNADFSVKTMFTMAVATSIDALAVGVTLKMAELSAVGLAGGALLATLCIGIITFLLSVVAVYIGKALGDKLTDKAELFGGLVLIAIGLKILIESFL